MCGISASDLEDTCCVCKHFEPIPLTDKLEKLGYEIPAYCVIFGEIGERANMGERLEVCDGTRFEFYIPEGEIE
jgi:hypothetical protein